MLQTPGLACYPHVSFFGGVCDEVGGGVGQGRGGGDDCSGDGGTIEKSGKYNEPFCCRYLV